MEQDEQLVARACHGEREAFDVLVRRHFPRLWRLARRFAFTDDDAHDLCQEAFVSAFAHLHELREPARFAEWVEAILRNTGRAWQRRRFVQPALLSLEEGEVAAPEEPEERRLLRTLVAQALAVLPVEQQRLLRLHYLHGYDYVETAALFHLPVPAVRGRLHRARQALRKEWRQMTLDTMPGVEIAGGDLDALRRAAAFASTDPKQETLNSLCFRDGALFTTDSYRLFCYRSAAFLELPTVPLHADLARALPASSARRGRLALEGEEAVLRLDTGEELRARVLHTTFPEVGRLVAYRPTATCFTARQGDWLEALELLAKQRNGATNTEHGPRLVLDIVPEAARVTLRQSFPATESTRVPWESSASFPAVFTQEARQVVVAANAEYLAEGLHGLGLASREQVEFATDGPLSPLRLGPPSRHDSFVLVMPMKAADG